MIQWSGRPPIQDMSYNMIIFTEGQFLLKILFDDSWNLAVFFQFFAVLAFPKPPILVVQEIDPSNSR